jgi:hypothetical protein
LLFALNAGTSVVRPAPFWSVVAGRPTYHSCATDETSNIKNNFVVSRAESGIGAALNLIAVILQRGGYLLPVN